MPSPYAGSLAGLRIAALAPAFVLRLQAYELQANIHVSRRFIPATVRGRRAFGLILPINGRSGGKHAVDNASNAAGSRHTQPWLRRIELIRCRHQWPPL